MTHLLQMQFTSAKSALAIKMQVQYIKVKMRYSGLHLHLTLHVQKYRPFIVISSVVVSSVCLVPAVKSVVRSL